MIHFYHRLYIGDSVQPDYRKIMHKAKRYKIQPGIYFITLPVNGLNNMEIYPSWVFHQKHYRKQDITVLGICFGMEEATKLVQDILMDCYHATGEFQVQKFVLEPRIPMSF